MTLDTAKLAERIAAAFALQAERTTQQVAEDLAAAIEAFVKTGRVVGISTVVQVDVDDGGHGVGTGQQDPDVAASLE